jgi:hypothetical protein
VDQSILIPTDRLKLPDLERFRNAPFEKMITFAVDVRLRKIASGGEMHSDGKEELLRVLNHNGLWRERRHSMGQRERTCSSSAALDPE